MTTPGTPRSPHSPHDAPTPAPDSHDARPERKLYRAAVVDTTSLVEAQARDDADHKATESREDRSKSWFKRAVNRIWEHNLAKDHVHQRRMDEARKKILQTGNLYVNEDGSTKAGTDAAMDSLVERFSNECRSELLRDEEKRSLSAPIVGNQQINDLVKSYASGSIDEAAFNAQKKTILSGIDRDYTSNEKLYADNLFKIANEVKDKYEHSRKLDDLDVNVELTLGKAKERLNTEAQLQGFDKAWTKFKKTGVGKLIGNEAFVGSVGAAVYSTIKFAGNRILRNKVAQLATFGLTGALSAGIATQNERARLKTDRAQHSREMAKGKTLESDMKRRNEMQKFNYETRGAREIISNLERNYAKISSGHASPADMQAAMAELADIESRVRVGEQKKIDLVNYSRFDQVEAESMQIDLLRARMKVALRNNDPHFDTQLNALADQRGAALKGGDAGIDKKDAGFKSMRRSKSWLTFGKTMLFGSIVGAGIHELSAPLDGHTDSLLTEGYKHSKGLVKGWFNHKGVVGGWNDNNMELRKGATPTLALMRWMTGEHARMPFGQGAHEFICGNSHLQLPEGAQIIENPNDTYSIIRDGKVIGDHVKLYFNGDGDLSEETKKMLAGHDIWTNRTVVGGISNVSATEYVKHNPELHKIHRELWYGNDTPKPVYDFNELKTWWGGTHGTGVDANGNYVFNMSRMTSDGSWQGMENVDAPDQIKHHGLKMLFSISRDSQHNVFEIPIDEHGNAIIPKDSELAKQLFTVDAKGHAVFTGKFVEVAQQTGVAKDGGEMQRILGTHVGRGKDMLLVDTRQSNIKFDLPEDTDIDIPPFFYINPRQPLERLDNPREVEPYGVTAPVDPAARLGNTQVYYGGFTPQQLEEEMGMVNDSYSVKEIDGKKVFVDKNGAPVVRNLEREKHAISDYLDKQDPEYLEELRNFESHTEKMNEKCRVAVNIPARFKGKNIGNLLDQYVKQVDRAGRPIDKDLFEINIIVNRKAGETADNSLAVISEWKRNNPGYHINVMDIEFPKEKANVGMARKYITDLTLMRSADRPAAGGPLYIESEDADLTAVDKRTIARLIEGFDEKPYLDVLRGVQDRQPEIMQKNDLLLFDRRMWDFAEAYMRKVAYRPENMRGSSFVWNRVISGGWNTAYTAEAYAKIGGYVPDIIGEDMKIGQKISILRGTKGVNGEYVLNTQTAEMSGLRSNSSPRRFIDTMAKNIGSYDDFEDQSLKEKTIDELLDGIKQYEKIDESQKASYENAINKLREFVYGTMPSPQNTEVFEKILWATGLKKENISVRSDGSIKLSDSGIPRIATLLEQYKNENRALKAYGRQNSTITAPAPRVAPLTVAPGGTTAAITAAVATSSSTSGRTPRVTYVPGSGGGRKRPRSSTERRPGSRREREGSSGGH